MTYTRPVQDEARKHPSWKGRWSGRPHLAEELLAPDGGCRDEDSQPPAGVCDCDAARSSRCSCAHAHTGSTKTKPNKKETAHEWEGRTGEMRKELEGKEWVGFDRNTLQA